MYVTLSNAKRSINTTKNFLETLPEEFTHTEFDVMRKAWNEKHEGYTSYGELSRSRAISCFHTFEEKGAFVKTREETFEKEVEVDGYLEPVKGRVFGRFGNDTRIFAEVMNLDLDMVYDAIYGYHPTPKNEKIARDYKTWRSVLKRGKFKTTVKVKRYYFSVDQSWVTRCLEN